jgi:hypothetical protein
MDLRLSFWYNNISFNFAQGGKTMRKITLIISLLFVFCPAGWAEIIEIGLIGQVDYVDDPYNLLENAVYQGDSITGYYIYDSETPDSEPSIYDGIYRHTSALYGMSLTAGSLTFQTDPTSVDFVIGLTDNYYGDPPDFYGITSYNNLPLINGVSIDNLHWQLRDYSGSALSSDALPLTAPNLSQWQSNMLSISGGLYPFPPGEKTLFRINGHVTSVWLIPEPATLFLFGLAGLFLRNRK